LLIDLHTHTYPDSDDSFMGPDELIGAAKRLGLDGVCLTEHDFFWSMAKLSTLSRRHDFLVLPGCELNTDEGHLLVFGLRRYVFGLHKPQVVRQLVDRAGGVIIAAHPHRRRFLEEPAQELHFRSAMLDRAAGAEFFRICDAIEGINGRATILENQFSQDLAGRLGLPLTGGSDAHRVTQLGTAATRFQRDITSLEDLVQELRAGRFQSVDLTNGNPDDIGAAKGMPR